MSEREKGGGEETDFGFQRVTARDKARRVGAVFDSVAESYDLMNDLMSLGLHRLWKRFAIDVADIRPGQRVLDLAGGTGDLSRRLHRRLGERGEVVLCDINAAMLATGRARLLDAGVATGVRYVRADAERLPFPDGSFDRVLIAFGLRNVTRKHTALADIHRVLRPGGRLLVLEFSSLTVPALKPLYDAYSFRWLPWLGRRVAEDADSYRYLAESIRMHPDQEALRAQLEQAGFERCDYYNLSAGVVAVHRGFKL